MGLSNDIKNIIDNMVKNAKIALDEYLKMDQKSIDLIVESVADAALKNSEKLAKMAILETKRGNYQDKIIKNNFASKNVFDSIKNKKTVGIIKENLEEGVIEIFDPLGVIAGVTPVTNPTSTVIFKILICIKTRNPIIFGFHPGAQNCSVETAKILKKAAIEAGAPEGSIQWIDTPSIEATSYLMNHFGVDVILATGGSEMVKAAYSAGKPALGVGPGNVPCYVEKTADLKRACSDIILSKTFDNGMICASEQAIIVDKEVDSQFEALTKDSGCYFLNYEETEKLSDFAFDFKKGRLNPHIVGKSALEIAGAVGIKVFENTKILVARLKEVGAKMPLSAEKLSPILAYYTADDTSHAFKICKEVLNFGGLGHTAAIHSENMEIIKKFGIEMQAGRIIVNSPSTHGAIGGIYNGNTPSLTIGCGSRGKNSVSSNISVEHLVNLKRIFLRKESI